MTRYLLVTSNNVDRIGVTGRDYRSLELQGEEGREGTFPNRFHSIRFYDRLDCPLIQTLFNLMLAIYTIALGSHLLLFR